MIGISFFIQLFTALLNDFACLKICGLFVVCTIQYFMLLLNYILIMLLVVFAVQNANVVKITDFGLAKLLDANEDVFQAAGGKVCLLCTAIVIILPCRLILR